MKRIVLGLAVVLLSSGAVMAGSFGFDLPRLDFPTQGGEVTQICNPLVQSCAD